jgi:hypothetical protein
MKLQNYAVEKTRLGIPMIFNEKGLHRYDPVANLLSEADTKERLHDIEKAVAVSANYMPKHRDFINEHCAA